MGAGGGWVLYGSYNVIGDSLANWFVIATLSFPMAIDATITACELEACVWRVAFAVAYLEGIVEARDVMKNWSTMDTRTMPTLQLASI